jgi:hypothetical protein
MADFSIDWEHWPVLVVEMRAAMTDAMVADYSAAIEKALARREKFANVFLSLTSSSKQDRKVLKRMADFSNANKDRLGELCLGSAVVLGSPAGRFILSSFLLLVRSPTPIRAFSSVEPAREWIDSLFEGASLKPPPQLARRLAEDP